MDYYTQFHALQYYVYLCKSGEFFTLQEVCNLLTRIVTIGKTKVRKVYAPPTVRALHCYNSPSCWARRTLGQVSSSWE